MDPVRAAPLGRILLWCTLPAGRDSAEFARAALAHGVVLAPGNAFSAALTAGSFMRFNVAQMDDQSFAVLRQLLREQQKRADPCGPAPLLG